MKYLFYLVLLIVSSITFAQVSPVNEGTDRQLTDVMRSEDQPARSVKKRVMMDTVVQKDTIRLGNKDFKLISHQRDTVALDSSLTIAKYYKFNFLKKDDFELMPFANMGQGYVSLTGDYNKNNQTYLPAIGGKAKSYHYMGVQDVRYYQVPIPTTEATFITSVDNGQFLDIYITFNMSKQFNLSIENTGFRSVGKYTGEDARFSNFRTSFNYTSKNTKYALRGHFVGLSSDHEEHGGLTRAEEQFESGDPRYLDRKIIDLRLYNASSMFKGKRYYMDHQYQLTRVAQDSSSKKRKSDLTIGHMMSFESRSVGYAQTGASDFFGTYENATINDQALLDLGIQQFSAAFSNPLLGTLKASMESNHYTYRFNSTSAPDSLGLNRLEDTELILGGNYLKRIGAFKVSGDLKYTLVGKLSDYLFHAALSGSIQNKHEFFLNLQLKSRMPDFNYLFYQSDYTNYRWDHREDFLFEKTSTLTFAMNSKSLGSLMASASLIDNFTYLTYLNPASTDDYDTFASGIQPLQASSSVGHLKLNYAKEFRFGKWAFDHTTMLQKIQQKDKALYVPDLITRNTLYYSSDVFDHAMFLQTGISFKYFSSYNANGYLPLMGEFYTRPQGELLGGYPLIDVFVNARIRQTRIFFKAEHLNAALSGYNYYSAPSYPYRDFVIRFGLVWNFFN